MLAVVWSAVRNRVGAECAAEKRGRDNTNQWLLHLDHPLDVVLCLRSGRACNPYHGFCHRTTASEHNRGNLLGFACLAGSERAARPAER